MVQKTKTPLESLKIRKEDDYSRPVKALIEINRERRQRESRDKLIKHLKPNK